MGGQEDECGQRIEVFVKIQKNIWVGGGGGGGGVRAGRVGSFGWGGGSGWM